MGDNSEIKIFELKSKTSGSVKAVVLPVAALFYILTGCATAPLNHKEEAPEWVTRAPTEKGMLCAVGASEPTYYPEDGKSYAAENARKELARTLNLNVSSVMVDMTEQRGERTEGSITEVSSWATDAVLRGSVIKEYWYDANGAVSFKRKGITYAIACMPANSAK